MAKKYFVITHSTNAPQSKTPRTHLYLNNEIYYSLQRGRTYTPGNYGYVSKRVQREPIIRFGLCLDNLGDGLRKWVLSNQGNSIAGLRQ